MLSLQFMPEADLAVAEMRRVVRPEGTVAAAVWETYGGMPSNRMFWDIAGVLDPDAIAQRSRMYFNPITQPGGLGALWRRLGLRDVRQNIAVREDHAFGRTFRSGGEQDHGPVVGLARDQRLV